MTLRELTQALAKGKNVRWASDGYKVYWLNDTIHAIYEPNGFTCALHTDEIEECYIKENH